jgi:hypothetical protein
MHLKLRLGDDTREDSSLLLTAKKGIGNTDVTVEVMGRGIIPLTNPGPK